MIRMLKWAFSILACLSCTSPFCLVNILRMLWTNIRKMAYLLHERLFWCGLQLWKYWDTPVMLLAEQTRQVVCTRLSLTSWCLNNLPLLKENTWGNNCKLVNGAQEPMPLDKATNELGEAEPIPTSPTHLTCPSCVLNSEYLAMHRLMSVWQGRDVETDMTSNKYSHITLHAPEAGQLEKVIGVRWDIVCHVSCCEISSDAPQHMPYPSVAPMLPGQEPSSVLLWAHPVNFICLLNILLKVKDLGKHQSVGHLNLPLVGPEATAKWSSESWLIDDIATLP